MAFCSKCGKELPAAATFCPSCGAPIGAATSTAQPGAPLSGIDSLMRDSKVQEYWVRRLIALVMDAVIIGIAVAVILGVFAFSFFLSGFSFTTLFFSGFSFVAGIILILYFPLLETTMGASVGKQLLGLKVVSRRGGNPTFFEAFIRNVSKINWVLLLVDVIVGLGVSKGYQQKYSDQLMGTSVVPAYA